MATWLPILVIASSLLPAFFILVIKEDSHVLRAAMSLTGATTKLVLVGYLLWGVANNQIYRASIPIAGDLSIVLHADSLSLLFITLSAVLWFFTTLYAIGYLEGSPNRARFFFFFNLCVSATSGIAMAGNLFTFILFYEILTLTTYPLVVHRGTPSSIKAGRVYLIFTIAGGLSLFLGWVWLSAIGGQVSFDRELSSLVLSSLEPWQARSIYLLFIVGLGVKAALVPLHFWLPKAMIAPAPVSALLHAVAVVKAGAFGIMRVNYDVFGIELTKSLGLNLPLAIAAATTIIFGSVWALFQDDLKRRLAYSTVSQVSYVTLGVAIAGPIATIGGLVHLVHQGLMKITLFFCAGNYAETYEIKKVSEMQGIGHTMPLTTAAFTLAAFGMIGLPPLAGFISKWYLGLGAVEAGQYWIVLVLIASTILNACYFLPIIYLAWFKAPKNQVSGNWRQREAPFLLLIPALVTAFCALGVGVFAATTWSPLSWAILIAKREYLP